MTTDGPVDVHEAIKRVTAYIPSSVRWGGLSVIDGNQLCAEDLHAVLAALSVAKTALQRIIAHNGNVVCHDCSSVELAQAALKELE